ncbi:E3 SUMO-protein ligase ZBED1-like isoform X1 [Musca domestica]|uniref:E3 SUMO-protein ligase ZBED1-like isoform X1 n=2 Tax=Musca TaxID=7369 RepID=A0A9J7DMZ4_MUSDO|nr:E3 SUMO-protein ligase ZBED1-like isoform X1 [Musca domestica]XP_061387973.1 E3 SUMO-protein ligase ZBED1-like isoform X1 [Musca vetustissima]XP_061396707.1 E3 SUMO-protein ligase ZBED1-like isoform X1 [Musca vetustissima]XP_061398239.1 E3 SUMO-protein ligase ZBED1-like isoform X1 [Musca vetustissima]
MEKFLKRSKTDSASKENVIDIGNINSGSESDIGFEKIRTRKMSSEAWAFFEKTKDGKHAKCRVCSQTYKTSGNTSNLFDHLKRAHPTFRELPKPANTIKPFLKNVETYANTSERKQAIDSALMGMIASDVQPFSIVNDKGFQKFIKCLDPRYELPSRNTLQNVHMANLHKKIKDKLQDILNEVDYCSITTDCWTSRANEGYLTVTCHFITNEFTLRSAVLSTKKLLVATNHGSDNIASSLRAVFNEWGIMEKVVCVVTDNDSTMIKACELLQKRHLPCYAHTINLLVQDCLNQTFIKENVLAKCKRIVTFFKSSTIAYQKFKDIQATVKPYSLLQEVPTRWNSAYRMIERILLTNDFISTVLLATSKAPSPLTADEIDFLKDLKEILSPFENATVQTSLSSSVSVSLIIPLTCGLFQSLQELKGKMKTPEGLQACLFLIERIKKRLFPYEDRTATRLGTLLDPRFKKEGFRSVFNADQASKVLENEMAAICKGHSSTVEPSTSQSMNNEPQQPLLNFMKSKIANKVRTSRVDAIVYTRQYFENENAPTESDPLEYWRYNANDMSSLKICATRYLCIPATSTESERMFSKAGLIISDRRTCLKSKNVDILLFLNKNDWITQ